MAGNNAIQLLRGSNTHTNTSISSQEMLDGQPLYDKSNGFLYMGTGTTIADTLPVNYKNVYNMGAFDTVTSNGDGTATITRKTYTVLDYASLDWYYAQSLGGISEVYYVHFEGIFDKTNTANMLISNNSKIHVQEGNEDYTTRLCDVGLQIIIPKTIANGDVDVMKAWLNEGGNIIAQIPLVTSYTENIIAETPINTLDVNGEQFVRNEWEKGLNLFNIDEANLSVTNNCSATKDENGNITIVKTGDDPYINDLFHFYATSTKYTVSARSNKNMQIFVNINGTYSNSQNIPTPVFTFNCNIGDSIYLRLDGNDESSGNTQTFSDIMLVEGSHAYPYQPYNGAIVHEKQLNDALEGYLPLTGGTMTGNINMGAKDIEFRGSDPGDLVFRDENNTEIGRVFIESGKLAIRGNNSASAPVTVNGQLQESGKRVYSPNNLPDRIQPYLSAHHQTSGTWCKFAEITMDTYISWGATFLISQGYDSSASCMLMWMGRSGANGGNYQGFLEVVSGTNLAGNIVCEQSGSGNSRTYSLYYNTGSGDTYVKFTLISDRAGNSGNTLKYPTTATMQEQPSNIIQTATYFGDNFYSEDNPPPKPTVTNNSDGTVNITFN